MFSDNFWIALYARILSQGVGGMQPGPAIVPSKMA